jgi:DNA recombination-dependent growth factor C
VGTEYGYDVCAGELNLRAEVATDLRAMLDCLREVRSRSEIEERVSLTGPLHAGKLNMHVGVVERGLDEMRKLIQDKGTIEIQHQARIR